MINFYFKPNDTVQNFKLSLPEIGKLCTIAFTNFTNIMSTLINFYSQPHVTVHSNPNLWWRSTTTVKKRNSWLNKGIQKIYSCVNSQ